MPIHCPATRSSPYQGSEPDHVARIQRRLLDWYESNRRELPWRDSGNPYAIVVSEFMLQQTGVDRVRSLFEQFLEKFPSFEQLAAAPRVEVLRAWAGLGYNRRAVNLHELAKRVVELGGDLPRDREALRRLPGVGPYTAAAILSFVFHDDVATVDTNVRRVVGRLRFGGVLPSESELARAAQDLVPSGWSSAWNQALMDFGSAQCTASRPPCLICPLFAMCRAAPIVSQQTDVRKVAERPEPYLGSRRYFRGRIVAHLRNLPPRGLLRPAELARSLGLGHDPEATALMDKLSRALAVDGLARVVESSDGLLVGPPE